MSVYQKSPIVWIEVFYIFWYNEYIKKGGQVYVKCNKSGSKLFL